MTPTRVVPTRVVIVNDASVARGGATGLALLSAELLVRRGIAVTFVTGDGGSADLATRGIDVVALGGQHIARGSRLSALRKGIHNAEAARLVERVICEHDGPATAYHVHGWSKILSPAIFAPLARVADRTLIHAHDYFLACPNGAYMNYPAARACPLRPLGPACLATQCDKRSYAHKLWRVGRSVALRRSLDVTRPWAGVVMIHPGMAEPLERGGIPARLLRAVRNPAVPFTEDRIPAERNRRLLFVGRVEAEKGVEDAVAAAARAGLPLTVVGDGPLRETLAARHPEVTFTGWLGREAIVGHVREARALLMPSRYPEPFGLVAAEASQSGLPVVVPRDALLGREVEDGAIGWTCDTRDPAAFAAVLAGLRDMPEGDLRAMSARAHARLAPMATSPEAWQSALLALLPSPPPAQGRPPPSRSP